MKALWEKCNNIVNIPLDPLNDDNNKTCIIMIMINSAIILVTFFLLFILIQPNTPSAQILITSIIDVILIVLRINFTTINQNILSIILLISVWVFATVLLLFFGNSLNMPVLPSIHLFLIIYVCLVYSLRASTLIPLSTLLILVVVWILDAQGIQIFPKNVQNIQQKIVGLIVFVPIVAYTIIQTVRNLNSSIALYKEELQNRILVEAELQALNQELEQRVEERTNQLEASNRDLEAFSYSISHDLRAPIRAIAGFSAALEESAQQNLDEECQDMLSRIENSAQRMDSMILGMLDLSRISRAELKTEEVNLSQIAKEIIPEIQTAYPTPPTQIHIEPEITAYGDERLFRILLTNLLQNAWKFSQKKETIDIEFSTQQRDEEKVYFIRDKGVGFNLQHADKLFTPFQRLHQWENYDGYGIGLATCKKIVQRHGGKIWAEAQPDEGATFFFTLAG